MGWIIIIVVVVGILFLMGMSGSSSATIKSMDDARNFIHRLKPTPWSAAKEMTPAQRAHCFFMPDIEDVDLIKTARAYVRDSLNGPPASARAEFGKEIGSNEHADSFDWASNYYHWLLHCVFHKLHDGREFRMAEFPLQNKRFNKSFCSPTVMIKEHDLTMSES